MDLYQDYLLIKSDKKHGEDSIDAITFSLFLANFVKGTVEDRVEMYICFLKKSNEDAVLVSDLQKVIFLFYCIVTYVY